CCLFRARHPHCRQCIEHVLSRTYMLLMRVAKHADPPVFVCLHPPQARTGARADFGSRDADIAATAPSYSQQAHRHISPTRTWPWSMVFTITLCVNHASR